MFRICLFSLLVATSAPADVVVTRLDAKEPVRGISLGADAKRVQVQTSEGKVVEIPIGQVVEAATVPVPEAPPEDKRPFEIRMLDGSVVRGRLEKAKPDHVRIVCPGLQAGAQALEIAIEDVLQVRRVADAEVPGASRLVRVPDRDAAYRLDGSRVTGTVEAFDADGVRLDRGDLGALSIPYGELAALFIDNAPGGERPGLVAIARLHDGSAIVLPAGFRIARGELSGETASGLAIRASAAEVVSLGFRGGQFEHLSDRAPARVEKKPFFPLPEGPTKEVMLDFVCPVRIDRSPDLNPIVLAGHRYYKGIGVRPETALTWKLEPEPGRPRFRLFTATCGIDDEVLGPQYGRGAGTGSVVFRVELDGKEVWASAVAEGGKPPQHVSIPLGAARELTLRVTVVPKDRMAQGREDSTELDNAVWARPLLIR